MRKGIIFTLDALVAVAVAVLALIIVTQIMSLRTGEWYNEIRLYTAAEDFLNSADKDGTLKAIFGMTDAQVISNLTTSMSSQLPVNMMARLNITICKYQIGFTCVRNITVGQAGSSQTKSVVRRIFSDSSNKNYSLVTMEIWYK